MNMISGTDVNWNMINRAGLDSMGCILAVQSICKKFAGE